MISIYIPLHSKEPCLNIKYIQHVIRFYCLPFQSLTASDAHLIASSVQHHPCVRELTVGGRCSESLVKGVVEGMARRHSVEKLAVTPYRWGACPYAFIIPLACVCHM